MEAGEPRQRVPRLRFKGAVGAEFVGPEPAGVAEGYAGAPRGWTGPGGREGRASRAPGLRTVSGPGSSRRGRGSGVGRGSVPKVTAEERRWSENGGDRRGPSSSALLSLSSRPPPPPSPPVAFPPLSQAPRPLLRRSALSRFEPPAGPIVSPSPSSSSPPPSLSFSAGSAGRVRGRGAATGQW